LKSIQWTGGAFLREQGSPNKLCSIKDLREDVPFSGSRELCQVVDSTALGIHISMQEDLHLGQRLGFGVFELDLRAGELRKHGLRIRLQEQPFRVLALLLEHPGDVITREELQKKLWPADTFVDFDHGLNKAISKIREALSDSAESPHFVETVARRGYRFLAEVMCTLALPALRSGSGEVRPAPKRFSPTRLTPAHKLKTVIGV
jgi:DNA-binding winged helix-turn-helix (wHTH) protein